METRQFADLLNGVSSVVSDSTHHVYEYIKRTGWKHYAVAAFAVVLLLLLGRTYLKPLLVLTIFGVIASYSTFYKRYIRVPSAVELVTLGTVVTSIAYGPVVGALFGAITTIASEVVSAAVDVFTFVYTFARIVIGVVAFYVYEPGMNMVVLGVGMVLLFNIIAQPFYLLPGDVETKLKAVYYFIISISFNALIFLLLGKFVLNLVL